MIHMTTTQFTAIRSSDKIVVASSTGVEIRHGRKVARTATIGGKRTATASVVLVGQRTADRPVEVIGTRSNAEAGRKEAHRLATQTMTRGGRNVGPYAVTPWLFVEAVEVTLPTPVEADEEAPSAMERRATIAAERRAAAAVRKVAERKAASLAKRRATLARKAEGQQLISLLINWCPMAFVPAPAPKPARKAPKAGAIDRAVVDGLLDGTISVPRPEREAARAVEVEAAARQVPDPATDPAWGAAMDVAASVAAAGAELVADAERTDATLRPSADRAERVARAQAEHRLMGEWISGGRKGDQPATPNLDAVHAEYASNGAGSQRKVRTPRVVNPRRAEALAENRRLNCKRGPGRKVTDEELSAYVEKVRAEHPESDRTAELEYAYWVEKLAVSRGRWYAAWAAAEAATV